MQLLRGLLTWCPYCRAWIWPERWVWREFQFLGRHICKACWDDAERAEAELVTGTREYLRNWLHGAPRYHGLHLTAAMNRLAGYRWVGSADPICLELDFDDALTLLAKSAVRGRSEWPLIPADGPTVYHASVEFTEDSTELDKVLGRTIYHHRPTKHHDSLRREVFSSGLFERDVNQHLHAIRPYAGSVYTAASGTVCIVWAEVNDQFLG